MNPKKSKEEHEAAFVEDVELNMDELKQDTSATLGNKAETELPLGKALWYYRKAVAWSVTICT